MTEVTQFDAFSLETEIDELEEITDTFGLTGCETILFSFKSEKCQFYALTLEKARELLEDIQFELSVRGEPALIDINEYL